MIWPTISSELFSAGVIVISGLERSYSSKKSMKRAGKFFAE